MDDPNPKPRPRIRIQIPHPADIPMEEDGESRAAQSATDEQLSAESRPVFVGETYCRNHPHSLARFFCHHCGKYFCDLCVAARPVEGRMARCCRLCGQPCQPVASAVAQPIAEPFGKLACQAFLYPFVADGFVLVLFGTLFLFLLDGLSWVSSFAGLLGLIAGIILAVFGGGYMFAFVKSVVLASAQGSDHLPDWPDVTDVSGDMVVPFFQYLVLLAFCLGPGLLLQAIGEVNENESMVWGGYALAFLGLCYLPMGLLGIAMFDSVIGLNPMLGIPSVGYTVGHYLLTLASFFAILAVGEGLDLLFEEVIHIPILPSLVSAFFTFYAMVVLARTIGLLFRVNENTLGWFQPRNR